MARAPLQIIVIPYRKNKNGEYEFALFHRRDNKIWHFVAGGAEGHETALQAARRELIEETGVTENLELVKLDSQASIPRTEFSDSAHWPKNLLVLPEFSFAVDFTDRNIELSEEHDEFRWLSFKEAGRLLKWDSNRVSLWELNQRLTGL